MGDACCARPSTATGSKTQPTTAGTVNPDQATPKRTASATSAQAAARSGDRRSDQCPGRTATLKGTVTPGGTARLQVRIRDHGAYGKSIPAGASLPSGRRGRVPSPDGLNPSDDLPYGVAENSFAGPSETDFTRRKPPRGTAGKCRSPSRSTFDHVAEQLQSNWTALSWTQKGEDSKTGWRRSTSSRPNRVFTANPSPPPAPASPPSRR